MTALNALAIDERRPVRLSVKQALSLCIVELVEDERGVVGLWQAHPQSDWEATRKIRLLGFFRRRDGRPASIDCTIPDDGSLRGSAQALVDEAMNASGKPSPPEHELGLIQRLAHLGIVESYGQPDRPGDCEISMVNFVAKYTGLPRVAAEERVRAHIGHRIERMAASLDQDAIKFANANHHANWIDEEEWEGLDATFLPGAPLRQAIAILPGFAGLFDALWRQDRAAFDDEPNAVLKAAISATCATAKDAPLRKVSRALIQSISCSAREITEAGRKAALKDTTAFLTMFGFKRQPPQSLEARAALQLTRFPSDWIPQSEDEWHALIELGQPIKLALSWGDPELSTDKLFPSRGRWRSYQSRLFKAASVDDIAALNRASHDIWDVMQAFERQILKPACALARFGEAAERVSDRDLRSVDFKPAVSRLLFKGRSMARLLEESRDWHIRQHEIANALSDISPGFLGSDTWKAGLPDWAIDDYQVKVLTSTAELKAEGKRGKGPDGMSGLFHCVGGYGPQCKSGRSRILSVRRVGQEGGAVRLSTVELNIDRKRISEAGLPLLKVVQHRGYRNEAAPEEAEEVLSSYLTALSSGAMACDTNVFTSLPSSIVTIAEEAGYEFWKPGAFTAALESWASLMPKALRNWDAEAFSEACKASF